MIRFILAAIFIFVACQLARAGDAPNPAATPVELVVSGRTSTLKSIIVQDIGQNIPPTFSKDHLKNVAGYTWYISRHYALQTDYDAARARHLLTLLELAYPHYLELFGREIPGIDERRMAVIYGKSADSLRAALTADGIDWNFNGGGITYEGINAAFNFPSGTLQYHQRYIMLHECAHLYQMCLNGTVGNTPAWYFEGLADAVANHVWEDSAQRLTMSVVDKPTINNWYDVGLAVYAKEPFKASEILTGKRGGRELGFLLLTYFNSDLHRQMRHRIWRDELVRLNKPDAVAADSARLIEELFGAEKLDADFDASIRARHSSFHYVDWGWEQDGDAMMSYGWPQSGAYSQTDLNFPPGRPPQFDPLVMDYPAHPLPALVGPVARGVEEPTVGCLIGLQASPDAGVAGMALGVEGRAFLKVLVEQRKRLVVDGTDVGAGRVVREFSGDFLKATEKNFQIGLTIRIGREALEVTARAGENNSPRIEGVSLPITATQRERLMTRPMAVLSRDGRHWITPCIDDPRRAEPDLTAPAPPNRWRFALAADLYALERAIWRLGKSAPPSLVAMRDRVLASAAGDAAAQQSLDADFAKDLALVLVDVRSCNAPLAAVQAALAELEAP